MEYIDDPKSCMIPGAFYWLIDLTSQKACNQENLTTFQECTNGHGSVTNKDHLSLTATARSKSQTAWSYTVENRTGFYRETSGNTTSVKFSFQHRWSQYQISIQTKNIPRSV